MRHRPRHILAFIALTGASSLLAAEAAPGVTPRASRAPSDVHLEITGLRSDKGLVRVCMTARPGRFPQCQGGEEAHVRTLPAEAEVSLDFRDVPAGRYAIAVLHDENGNGKVDRALGLMPKEGFGFSRDAPVRLGPPSFKQASFEVTADVQQTIRMRYMF